MDPTDRSHPIVKSITTLYKMVVHQDGRISVAQHGVLQCVAVCCSVLQCVAVHVVHQDGRISVAQHGYGVATIGKLLDIIGLFCKRAL